ncbi:17.5 kDa class I heat shock protein-like [Solanum pennellii]|uniref:17.5 kDa class I heat shock protein-like n=1 Tax=Solanum pennellii TaxID=28526 RepID=A0ABM1GD61_SOLPN|nr:17.5 kDa class I heat shock protein-like [Solanum pennellii]
MAHYEYYKRGANSVYEDIEPSSSWIEDTQNHYLLIDLPGFKREEVKLQVDIFGNIMVNGERKVREYKSIRFQKSVKAPEKSKYEDTSVKLEDGILYVIIPKEVPENNEHDETANDSSGHEDNQQKDTEEIESSNGDVSEKKENDIQGLSQDDEFHDAKMAKKRHEVGIVIAGKEILRKNKSIVITAVLAFSFGVFISKKSKSSKMNQAS